MRRIGQIIGASGALPIRPGLLIFPGLSVSIRWIALDSGEYTADTLPPYQPKGYAAEYAVCRQYDPVTGDYCGLASDRALDAIRRKLSTLAGYVDATLKGYVKKRSVKVEELNPALGGVTFMCSTGDGYRRCTLVLDPAKPDCYQIIRLSNYMVYGLFSASEGNTNKTLAGLWIDGKWYDTTDVLNQERFSFDNMMLLYTVNEEGYTINTCVCLSADGIKIYESIPETTGTNRLLKECIKGSTQGNLIPIVSQGDGLLIFRMIDTVRPYINTVEDLGQTVIKTIAFNGRV